MTDTATEEKLPPSEDVTEAIEPSVATKLWTLGVGENSTVYEQRPLSFFGKLELTGKLGEILDDAMNTGLSLDSILTTGRSASDADFFMRALVKLATMVPYRMPELFCIFLGVPRGERAWATLMMERDGDNGGLSDDDGISIMETFLDQNLEIMQSFFGDRLLPLYTRVKNRFSRVDQAPSKPLKATRRNTQKA